MPFFLRYVYLYLFHNVRSVPFKTGWTPSLTRGISVKYSPVV